MGYTCYILTLKFLYILFKISVVYTKNLPLFSTNRKFSHMRFLNFVEYLLFFWNFLKFFPQFIQNSSSFPEYFLKIFTLKISFNIAWRCYEGTNFWPYRYLWKCFMDFSTRAELLCHQKGVTGGCEIHKTLP